MFEEYKLGYSDGFAARPANSHFEYGEHQWLLYKAGYSEGYRIYKYVMSLAKW